MLFIVVDSITGGSCLRAPDAVYWVAAAVIGGGGSLGGARYALSSDATAWAGFGPFGPTSDISDVILPAKSAACARRAVLR